MVMLTCRDKAALCSPSTFSLCLATISNRRRRFSLSSKPKRGSVD
jgi:hypothetical protein